MGKPAPTTESSRAASTAKREPRDPNVKKRPAESESSKAATLKEQLSKSVTGKPLLESANTDASSDFEGEGDDEEWEDEGLDWLDEDEESTDWGPEEDDEDEEEEEDPDYDKKDLLLAMHPMGKEQHGWDMESPLSDWKGIRIDISGSRPICRGEVDGKEFTVRF